MTTNEKSIKHSLEDTADAARKVVSDAAETTSRKVHDAASDLSAKATDAAGKVRDSAIHHLEDARDSLGDTGDRLAETLRRASKEPEPGSVQARVLSAVASGVSSAADTLHDRSLTQIIDDVKAMARRNPGVFAAGAAVAGFALARFLRSSSVQMRDRYNVADASHGPSGHNRNYPADGPRS